MEGEKQLAKDNDMQQIIKTVAKLKINNLQKLKIVYEKNATSHPGITQLKSKFSKNNYFKNFFFLDFQGQCKNVIVKTFSSRHREIFVLSKKLWLFILLLGHFRTDMTKKKTSKNFKLQT